jgi:hypothetical protein
MTQAAAQPRRVWQPQLGYYRMPFQLTIQCTNSTCS